MNLIRNFIALPQWHGMADTTDIDTTSLKWTHPAMRHDVIREVSLPMNDLLW